MVVDVDDDGTALVDSYTTIISGTPETSVDVASVETLLFVGSRTFSKTRYVQKSFFRIFQMCDIYVIYIIFITNPGYHERDINVL